MAMMGLAKFSGTMPDRVAVVEPAAAYLKFTLRGNRRALEQPILYRERHSGRGRGRELPQLLIEMRDDRWQDRISGKRQHRRLGFR